MGKIGPTLRASLVAFHETPGLAAYVRVQELAGDRWPEYRSELLAYLRQTGASHASGKVDVFLHEGLVADAIAGSNGEPSTRWQRR